MYRTVTFTRENLSRDRKEGIDNMRRLLINEDANNLCNTDRCLSLLQTIHVQTRQPQTKDSTFNTSTPRRCNNIPEVKRTHFIRNAYMLLRQPSDSTLQTNTPYIEIGGTIVASVRRCS